MNVLVLFAHPVETSFQAAVHETVVETLSARGHTVDDCDLYAENFNPCLSREERLAYHDLEADRSAIQPYVDRLRAAEALILVFPVWNFGYPAILKGFFDRVFLPGVSFRMENGKALRPEPAPSADSSTAGNSHVQRRHILSGIRNRSAAH